MTALLIALAAAVAPSNVVQVVSQRDLARARDRWLLATLGLGSAWLAFNGALWLALIGLWFLLTWRDTEARSSLLLWVAIGTSWFLLRSMPELAWQFLPWAWLLGAAGQVAFAIVMQFKAHWPQDNRLKLGWRSKGWLGSPVITSLLLAMVAPFCPWWGWPVLLIGAYLTFSYTCFVGLAIGVAWMHPTWTWPLVWTLVGLFTLLAITKHNSRDVVGKATFAQQRLLEWTPRGDSVDGWWGRWLADQLLLAEWLTNGRIWLGHGPGSATKALQRWTSMQSQELPNGEAHADLLQTLYEYGALGGLAVLAFVLPILGNLRIGDPWSASWVVFVVISFLHWPARHPSLGLLFLAVSARLV